ncbi:MAG: M42 family metallopeptidase [Methanomassiliicoccales archaeon]|jgi:putative aminopeptidase FrvX|nr:M42 family metallopeptidase [Methanomassiliicoccales archaeon]
MLEELTELLKAPGVSGFESPIREMIKKKVETLTETRVDEIGNLYATIGDGDRHLLLVAHMDELGMVVSKIEESGFLHFRKIGGIDDRSLPGKTVTVFTTRGEVKGVIGMLPPHLMKDPSAEAKEVPTAEEMLIDIGCSSKKEAEEIGVSIMDPIVFEKSVTRLNERIVSARGLDNRSGCLALIELLRRLHKKGIGLRVTFVWSVQEEIGLRGVRVAALKERPDYVIAVDTCSATDFPGAPGYLEKISLGKGPVVRYIDNKSIASPALVNLVRRVAASNGLPLQLGISGGSTDGAAAQEFGSLMVPLCIPVRYTHSTVECIHLEDLRNLILLLEKTIDDLEKREKGVVT